MVETQFIDDRTLRDRNVGRFEILEKVKKVLLIPNTDFMTVNQLAEYYSTHYKDESKNDNIITSDGIRKLYSLHSDELDGDGVCIKSYKDFLIGNEFTLENLKGKVKLTHISGVSFDIPNRGIRVFPRRAILRVGMLLRDSEVAKEIRTQLLNIEKKTSNEIKIHDIDEEQSLMLSVGMAVASGNATAVAVASAKLVEFKNRHIQKLENDNKALAKGILEWCDRNKLNAGIRQLASATGIHFSKMWNELYKNIQYKYGICVKQRGSAPYIQWIEEVEWDNVMKTFCAMCEAYEQSPTEMLQQNTPISNLKKIN